MQRHHLKPMEHQMPSTVKHGYSVHEHKLQAHERPKLMYEYFVSGSGSFPIDMLRHDSAWPATGEDASRITEQMDFQLRPRGITSIKLRSYRMPTVARWASFTWSVTAEKNGASQNESDR
jgi:hypothetical protein